MAYRNSNSDNRFCLQFLNCITSSSISFVLFSLLLTFNGGIFSVLKNPPAIFKLNVEFLCADAFSWLSKLCLKFDIGFISNSNCFNGFNSWSLFRRSLTWLTTTKGFAFSANNLADLILFLFPLPSISGKEMFSDDFCFAGLKELHIWAFWSLAKSAKGHGPVLLFFNKGFRLGVFFFSVK